MRYVEGYFFFTAPTMPALSPDLRRALFSLPEREKDQLLARLVAQDAVLTEQLAYRLLEPVTVASGRATVRAVSGRIWARAGSCGSPSNKSNR